MNIKTTGMFTLVSVLALLISACGTKATPTAAPANTFIPPTDVPLQPTNTAEPVVEPSATPTEQLAPVFDSALLLTTPNLPAFSRSISDTRNGTGTDDQKIDAKRSVVLDFDRDHAFSSNNVEVAGVDSSGEEFVSTGMLYTTGSGLLTEVVDVAKLYFSDELAEAYKTNSLENPTTSIVESLDAISTTMTTESPFGWVVNPTFVGQEIENDIPCNHYTFDETSLDSAALPSGMTLTSASGDLCLAVDGGYLVHGEGKIEGQNLYPSPKTAEVAMKSGWIEFMQDVKQLEPGFSTGIVPELITQVSAPAGIAVPADYRLALSQITDEGQSYMYISDQPIEAITDQFKTVMPAQGWSLVSSEENAGTYTYELNKDDMNIEVWVVDGVALPGVKTITIVKSQ